MNTYKPNEFAEILGVSVKTLQRWDKDGKLKAFRNPSDRRYYTDEHLEYFNRGRRSICEPTKLK
jgi:DNA-binding transcriptional MerR regulator